MPVRHRVNINLKSEKMNGFQLKKIRLTMEISQSQLAKKLGVTQSVIAKIENGRDIEKYASKIKSIFHDWRVNRCNMLQDEIDYLHSL
jgi:predicted transcriptional regulator